MDFETALASALHADGETVEIVGGFADALFVVVFWLQFFAVTFDDFVETLCAFVNDSIAQAAQLFAEDDVANREPHFGDEFGIVLVTTLEALAAPVVVHKEIVTDGARCRRAAGVHGNGGICAEYFGESKAEGAFAGGVVEAVAGFDVEGLQPVFGEGGDLILGRHIAFDADGNGFGRADGKDVFAFGVAAKFEEGSNARIAAAVGGVEAVEAGAGGGIPNGIVAGVMLAAEFAGDDAPGSESSHGLADALIVVLPGFFAVSFFDGVKFFRADEVGIFYFAVDEGKVKVGRVAAIQGDNGSVKEGAFPSFCFSSVLVVVPAVDRFGGDAKRVGLIEGIARHDAFEIVFAVPVGIGVEKAGGHEADFIAGMTEARGFDADEGGKADEGVTFFTIMNNYTIYGITWVTLNFDIVDCIALFTFIESFITS